MTCKSPQMAVLGVMLILLFAAGSTGAVPCVESCSGKANENYPSCEGCNYFVTCSYGNMYTTKCQSGLEWDQARDRCVWAPAPVCCFRDTATLSVACADYLAVYVDGVRATSSNANENTWWASSDYPLTDCNSLIAIACRNGGGSAGLLASTTTGVKTDTTWRCTDQLETGWETVGFTETAGVWGNPASDGENGDEPHPWPLFTDILPSAEWIWYGPNLVNDKTTYCRKNI